MRSLAVAVAILTAAFPACALKQTSVSQLEQTIGAEPSKHDIDVAHRLQELALTERLSMEHRAALEKQLPGPQSRAALRALADESVFHAPPAAEVPPAAEPGITEQRRILGLTVEYVRAAIPQLPNFMATRTTEHFEDRPQMFTADGGSIAYQPMHSVGVTVAGVFYREGKELVEDSANVRQHELPANGGLSTQGIFGPFQSRVLVDAAQSALHWLRWEHAADGVYAVFQFRVPLDKSHYNVSYCCVPNASATLAADLEVYNRVVGYHGEMTVDPTTGAIRRLMVDAELAAGAPVARSAIVVEYGPVQIGGRSYICPLRSVSLIVGQTFQANVRYGYALANQMQPLRTLLNESVFDKYHIFRVEMRLLTADAALGADAAPAPPAAESAQANSAPAAEDNAVTQPVAIILVPTKTSEAPPGSPVSTAALTLPPLDTNGNAPPAEATPPPAAEPAEMTLEAATAAPDAATPAARGTEFTLRTTSRLVDVPLVAFDKKGRPITNLKSGDLMLLDNGRPQKIASFTQTASEAATSTPATSVSASTEEFSNRVEGAKPQPKTNQTLLLVDSRSLPFSDWTHAREETLRYLAKAPADERIGFYTLRRFSFAVVMEPTLDHAALQAAIQKWMPNAADLALAQRGEARNRQDIDYVTSVTDLLAVNGNDPSASPLSSMISSDPQLQKMGSNPQADSLAAMQYVARHLAGLPGHKSLIWISSDNVLADWQSTDVSQDEEIKQIAGFELRAREALNEAHTSLYALDVSELEASGVSAAHAGTNVQINPATSAEKVQSELMMLPQDQRQQAQDMIAQSQKNTTPGRIFAQGKQDMHPIAAEYRNLAEGTGGRALRRAGDIATKLDGIVNDGRAAYQLSFTPDTPADGQYHTIAVTWADKRKGALRYRTGYLYKKEPETMKDRVRAAIWEPGDAREIGLAASVESSATGSALKLNISATDLALNELSNRWLDRLDLMIVTRDDATLRAKVDGQTLALRLRPETYQTALRDGLSVELPAPAMPMTGTVRVIVIDQGSGRLGSVTLPAARMPKPAQQPGR